MKAVFGDWPTPETGAAAAIAARSGDTQEFLELTADLPHKERVAKVAGHICRGFEVSLAASPEIAEEAGATMAAVDWRAVAEHLVNEHKMHAMISRSLSELRDRLPRSRRFGDKQIVLDVRQIGDDGIDVRAEMDGKPCCPLCGDLAPDDLDSRPTSTGLVTTGGVDQADTSEESAMHILMCSECQEALIPPGLITMGTH